MFDPRDPDPAALLHFLAIRTAIAVVNLGDLLLEAVLMIPLLWYSLQLVVLRRLQRIVRTCADRL